ncbi:hypothetical protein DM860_017595 [Cuscuta australis]|uniref:DUF4283 domain-containing protein n=1 Tax=Cuscuta australis TaxID=267555 RepID=A0A328D9K5_9ASTE|nr:hypothetical protein DM860_017595 [Cuscuta australis]
MGDNIHSFVDVVSPHHPPTRFKGLPSISFSDEEIHRLSGTFRRSLVGSLIEKRPPLIVIRKTLEKIGFSDSFKLGLLDDSHVLLQFESETDFLRCLLRNRWIIGSSYMRVFRWTADFDPSVESPLVPVWVGLEGLPIHLFHKPTLFSIAKRFGSPLQTDAATANLNRPNVARVCVEVNLSKELPKAIWIHLGSSSYLQPLLFENLPSYCNSCHQLGHKSCKSGSRNLRWVRKTKPRGKVVNEAPGQPVSFPSNSAVQTSTTPITFGSLEPGHQYVTTKDIGACPKMNKNDTPCLDNFALAPPTDAIFETLNGPPHTSLDSTTLTLPTDAKLGDSYLECAQHKDTTDSPPLAGPCGLEFTIEGPSCPDEHGLSPQILPQFQNDGYDLNHADENMRAHETHSDSSDGTPSDPTILPIGNDDAFSDPSIHNKAHTGKENEAGNDAPTEAELASPHTLEDNTNISCEPRSHCRYIKVTNQRSSPSLQELQTLSFTEQITRLKRGHQQLNSMQPKATFDSIQGKAPKPVVANLFEVL